MKLRLHYLLVFFVFFSCSKPNNYSTVINEVRQEFFINVASTNQNFVVSSPYADGVFNLKVMVDNGIEYKLNIPNPVTFAEFFNTIEIRLGDPNTDNGPLLAVLPGRFGPGTAQGILTGLRNGFIDTLLNVNIPKYINLITTNQPLGYLRGQINNNIVYSNNIGLSGANIRPAVPTSTSGLAFVRVTANQLLYSKVAIFNDDPADPVLGSKLFAGNVFDPGAEILTLANSPAQLTSPSVVLLTNSQFAQLLNGSFYMNVQSAAYPGGKIRGQVK